MKRHLGWLHVAATAAIVAGSNLPHAVAQYAPYRPIPQQPAQRPVAAPQQVAPAVQPMYMAYRPQGPQYRGPAAAPYGQPAGYPQTAAGYPQTAATYPQTAMHYPQYQGYPLVAQQPTETMPAPTPSETLPMPPGATNGVVPTNGTVVPNGGPVPNGHGVPMQDHGYMGTGGYPSTGGHGNVSGYGYGYGSNCGYQDYGVSGYMDQSCHDTQWFGGVYGLFMNRDDGEFRRLTAQLDTPSAYPYYPPAVETVLSTENVDHDFREGFEVRFGSTLCSNGWYEDDCNRYGYGHGCDTGCEQSCATATFAWEVGYWLLDDDVNTAQVVDAIPTDTYRMYGMKNFAGIEYNGEPVNLWYDYQVPVEDPANPPPWGTGTLVRVLAQRVRSNFRAQNLELNLLRLPICGTSSCGYSSSGCDDGNGYGAANCAPVCESPFSIATLCGFRYLRIDDDFQYATMWAIDDGTGTLTPPAYTPWDGAGELYYDINVDNHLAGFQLGANMNYCVSCKCNVFWNTNFGLYNNHITTYQRVYGELGSATWVGSGENVSVNVDKDDVAFVGEMQVGGSYDFTCNWRGILAYRAVGISGVALSVDQIPEDFSSREQVASIDSNGSLIIHGVQAGVECRY